MERSEYKPFAGLQEARRNMRISNVLFFMNFPVSCGSACLAADWIPAGKNAGPWDGSKVIQHLFQYKEMRGMTLTWRYITHISLTLISLRTAISRGDAKPARRQAGPQRKTKTCNKEICEMLFSGINGFLQELKGERRKNRW